MRTPDTARPRLVSIGVAALLAMTAATAQVATGTTGIDASGNYQQEVNACMTGKTQQDRDTCLREARNAQADKKRGALDNAGASFEVERSGTLRCLHGRGKGRLPGPHDGLRQHQRQRCRRRPAARSGNRGDAARLKAR